MDEFATRSGLLVAVVAITGFAIQQLLQLADPFVEAFIGFYKTRRRRNGRLPLPNAMSEAEFKKSVMGTVAFGIGVAIAANTNIGRWATRSRVDRAGRMLTRRNRQSMRRALACGG